MDTIWSLYKRNYGSLLYTSVITTHGVAQGSLQLIMPVPAFTTGAQAQRTTACENGIWGHTVFSFFVLKCANEIGTIQTMLPIVFIFEDIWRKKSGKPNSFFDSGVTSVALTAYSKQINKKLHHRQFGIFTYATITNKHWSFLFRCNMNGFNYFINHLNFLK